MMGRHFTGLLEHTAMVRSSLGTSEKSGRRRRFLLLATDFIASALLWDRSRMHRSQGQIHWIFQCGELDTELLIIATALH